MWNGKVCHLRSNQVAVRQVSCSAFVFIDTKKLDMDGVKRRMERSMVHNDHGKLFISTLRLVILLKNYK
jgi:hypothetical protein